jgi:hypothetical protein
MTDNEQRAREAVRKARKNLPWLESKAGNRQFFRAHWEVMDPDQLVEAAREGDPDALEILREHARGARRTGMCISDNFHAFVWEYFIDGRPKAKRGPSPKDNDLRYQTIAVLVRMVSTDYGFPEYRNVEHRGEKTGPMSACLLVAQEFGLEERWVEEIYGHRKAGLEENSLKPSVRTSSTR